MSRIDAEGLSSDPGTALVLMGLGNPGSEYRDTRHNVGFACIEALAQKLGIRIDRRRWHARVGQTELGGRRLWLLEPQTFMNDSGRAAREALRDLGFPVHALWVVHDELDLPLGRMRIKLGGSAAGHNGIRSLITALGGRSDFVRFRVGVGKPDQAGSKAGVEHVLGRFSRAQGELVTQIEARVADALYLALEAGLERAMERYNRPSALLEDSPR
ncbi:MAG TPA: aminoacyl-tRNA hydrolase [Candidatus Nitrosotalea sp.]|nr:aminoacyl-tRNA hydrolase [Candidatus Nitrosotalea sp.]